MSASAPTPRLRLPPRCAGSRGRDRGAAGQPPRVGQAPAHVAHGSRAVCSPMAVLASFTRSSSPSPSWSCRARADAWSTSSRSRCSNGRCPTTCEGGCSGCSTRRSSSPSLPARCCPAAGRPHGLSGMLIALGLGVTPRVARRPPHARPRPRRSRARLVAPIIELLAPPDSGARDTAGHRAARPSGEHRRGGRGRVVIAQETRR